MQLIRRQMILNVDPLPDFDMNTLCISERGMVSVLEDCVECLVVDVKDVIQNLLRMKCYQLKTVEDIQDEKMQTKFANRLLKMKTRGYDIMM